MVSWVRRLAKSCFTLTRRLVRSAVKKQPLKYLIVSYRVFRDDPPQEWHRQVKIYEFAFWAVALSATLSALDPTHTEAASWIDGFNSLSKEQSDQFIQVLNLRGVMEYDWLANPPGDYVLRQEDLIAEALAPGSSSAAKRIQSKVGSIDPFRIGAYLAMENPPLGNAFINGVERETRLRGLTSKLFNFCSQFVFLLGFLLVHYLVAPKGTPLKTRRSHIFWSLERQLRSSADRFGSEWA